MDAATEHGRRRHSVQFHGLEPGLALQDLITGLARESPDDCALRPNLTTTGPQPAHRQGAVMYVTCRAAAGLDSGCGRARAVGSLVLISAFHSYFRPCAFACSHHLSQPLTEKALYWSLTVTHDLDVAPLFSGEY
ncbi:hypothetical protein [Actinomadura gamaensis]|uniref:Uncharacterized protein n=1 Tax=Actinomadura gamaensis TaxID=1763541 RepID=A0ABV9UA00_9ACTN